jgi:hypothetical protein
MTPQTLKEFKGRMTEFYPLVRSLSKYFKSQKGYELIEVLVQNLAFSGIGSLGYDHEKEVKKCVEIIKVLEKFSNWEKSHFESYVYETVDYIFSGLAMSEVIEQNS